MLMEGSRAGGGGSGGPGRPGKGGGSGGGRGAGGSGSSGSPGGPGGGGGEGDGGMNLGGFDLGAIMRQAQRVQDELSRAQETAGTKTVEASAGGGMVTVVANGRREVVSVTIDPVALEAKDVQLLQDLIVSAVNQALTRAQEMLSEELSQVTGGLRIPGIL
jgi:DNA-binding YbaB/EbfC family protein